MIYIELIKFGLRVSKLALSFHCKTIYSYISSLFSAITKINSAWLPTLGKPLCTFSKPLETSTPAQIAAAGKGTSDTRQSFVVPRFGTGVGIELKPIQVTQKLVQGRWVLV